MTPQADVLVIRSGRCQYSWRCSLTLTAGKRETGPEEITFCAWDPLLHQQRLANC